MKHIVALALFATAGCAHAAQRGVLTAQQMAACPTLGADFARTKVLKLYRAYTGPDGHSKIEEKEIDGKDGVYYEGTVSLRQFGLGDPTNVVIVYGHPNMKIAPHPSPYREIFLIVSGSSAIELHDGTRVELKPGSMVLSEDQGSKGRGGTSGPCGYVAIDFQFKDAPTK
jgi:hypothetical protein